MNYLEVFLSLQQLAKMAASNKVNGHFLFLLLLTIGYTAMVCPAVASVIRDIIGLALSMALALLPFLPPLVLLHMFFMHPKTYAELESTTLLFVGKLVSILGNHFHGLSIKWMEGHPGLQSFFHQLSTRGLGQLIQDLAVPISEPSVSPPHTPLAQRQITPTTSAQPSPAMTVGNQNTTEEEPNTDQLIGGSEISGSESESDSDRSYFNDPSGEKYDQEDDDEDDGQSGTTELSTTTIDEILMGLGVGVCETHSPASDEAESGFHPDIEDPLTDGAESSPGVIGPVTVPKRQLRIPFSLEWLGFSRGGRYQAPETPCPKRAWKTGTKAHHHSRYRNHHQIPRSPSPRSPKECETLAGLVASSIMEPQPSPVVQRYASDNTAGYLRPPPGFEGVIPDEVPFWATGSPFKREVPGIHRRVSRFAHLF